MSWRFRKSFSPIPGVRLTISPSGISTSVGAGPLRVTVGQRGAALTATVPGTGLSFRQPLSNPPSKPSPKFAPTVLPGATPLQPPTPPSSVIGSNGMQEIRSAGSSELTTPGLEDFKKALMLAESQYAETSGELKHAKVEEGKNVKLARSWEQGFVFKRIFKKRFAEIKNQAAESVARRVELDKQLEQCMLKTEFDMPDGVARAFSRLCDDFAACTRSQRIWDNVAHRAANRVAERTTASRIVDLKPVQFSLGKCSVIETATPVPRLENANGGDIFFYPGFLIYHASSTNYALIEYQELDLQVVRTQFQEEGSVPTDAEQVGTTWAKANKDGSPDRRFANNYQIPVMRYARLTLNTQSGLNEEYMLSNVGAAEQFHSSWKALLESVRSGR